LRGAQNISRNFEQGNWRMKLLSFAADGKEWFGAARDAGVITLNDKIGQPNLRAALAASAIETMRSAAKDATPDRKLSAITFLPVIPHPNKILCAGINYRSHATEMGRDLPKQPSMFIRRLHLLRRWQRTRLSEILGDVGQEFSRHRAVRALARHHRRNSGPEPPYFGDAP
jgi:hypothetical protein